MHDETFVIHDGPLGAHNGSIVMRGGSVRRGTFGMHGGRLPGRVNR
jgi:hypothetical protein